MKTDFPDLRQRFDEFAGKFGERTRRHWQGATGARPSQQALNEDYWQTVQDLFTRDVTGKGLRELVEQDTTDTFRFFTREVDFEQFSHWPWYKRYPLGVWRVFLAMAYRLSPARRILFAVGVPLLWLGWLRYMLAMVDQGHWRVAPIFSMVVVSATLLFVLLVLELKDKLALKGDLEIARQIQFGLLPFEPFRRASIGIRVSMRPANTVGGDYFDVIELGEGRIAVVVGDVAGKGMPAALLMALLQGSLRTLITAGLRGADLVAKLNDHLCANIPSNRLVTFFYSELDPETGAFTYVNAGHNPPFLLRSNGPHERLAPTGVALGVIPASAFDSAAATLAPGDRLLLFTDGVTEAFNPNDLEYGEERLEIFLRQHQSVPAEALIADLIADVLRFCGSVKPRDDMTLLLLGRDSAPAASAPSESGADRSS